MLTVCLQHTSTIVYTELHLQTGVIQGICMQWYLNKRVVKVCMHKLVYISLNKVKAMSKSYKLL